jgi:hypothetical protein
MHLVGLLQPERARFRTLTVRITIPPRGAAKNVGSFRLLRDILLDQEVYFMNRLVRGAALAVGAALLIASCSITISIEGSRATVTQSLDVPSSGISAIDAGSAFDVTVAGGDAYAVTVTVSENLYERGYLDASFENQELVLRMDGFLPLFNYIARAHVTVPSGVLETVNLSGASSVDLGSGVTVADSLKIDVSGASRITGTIPASEIDATLSGASSGRLTINDATTTTFDVSGASSLTVAGQVTTIESLVVSGASDVDTSDFTAQDVEIDVSGASTLDVYASGTLSGAVSGASTVRYYGSPSRNAF